MQHNANCVAWVSYKENSMEFNKYQYYASNSNEESEVFLEKLKLLKTKKRAIKLALF